MKKHTFILLAILSLSSAFADCTTFFKNSSANDEVFGNQGKLNAIYSCNLIHSDVPQRSKRDILCVADIQGVRNSKKVSDIIILRSRSEYENLPAASEITTIRSDHKARRSHIFELADAIVGKQNIERKPGKLRANISGSTKYVKIETNLTLEVDERGRIMGRLVSDERKDQRGFQTVINDHYRCMMEEVLY